jgi:prepilin-type N-terminal cleavage/methylation domain-containing protein
MHPLSRQAFTLIELLVVIAIIAILAIVVVLTLNPAALLQQSRDSNRVSDMATLNSAINLYNVDQSGSSGYSLGSSNTVYVSIPDPTATSSLGDQCQGLGLISLPATYTYHCAASSTYRNVNGTGWIPVNFSNISTGSPLGSLPVDPVNASSSRLYYTYTTNGNQFETTAVMESAKYQLGGSNDVISTDGGTLASVYEKGSELGLEPLDYGDPSLVGFWSLDEGTGTVAYDYSGNNAAGGWSGTQAGTNGYYSAGKARPWAGYFNGTNDNIGVLNPSSQITGPITMMAWLNPSISNGDVVGYSGYNPTWGYTLTCYDNVLGIRFQDSLSTWYEAFSSIAVSLNTWQYIAVTYNQQNAKFYVNGTLQQTVPYTHSAANVSSTINIGSVGWSPQSGSIDDVRIYSRALSPAQISAMYAGGK